MHLFQMELIDEAKMMISDCSNRLSKAVGSLECAIAECNDLAESEEYKNAELEITQKSAGDN